jgi:hypothetical protein
MIEQRVDGLEGPRQLGEVHDPAELRVELTRDM